MKRITPGSRKQHRISKSEEQRARAMGSLAVMTAERNRYAARCALYDKEMLRDADIMERQQEEIAKLRLRVNLLTSDTAMFQSENTALRECLVEQAAALRQKENQLRATAEALRTAQRQALHFERIVIDHLPEPNPVEGDPLQSWPWEIKPLIDERRYASA